MHSKICIYGVLAFIFVVFCIGSKSEQSFNTKSVKSIEFSKISRGSLLKLLAAFEKNISGHLAAQKKKPLFTASFANNKITSIWSKTSCKQLSCGLWASLVNVTIGMSVGFPGITLPELMREDSLMHIKKCDAVWIASILTLFAPVGCMISGYLMDKYGRKIILIICEVPICVGWLYTGFASSAKDLIIGRAITGVGCGMAMGAPVAYITEITLPNLRGVVGVLPNVAESVGLTLQAVLGTYVNWKITCFVAAIISATICVSNCFLHESPYFQLVRSTEENTLKSLKNFRSASFDVRKELDDILDFKSTNSLRRLTFTGEVKLLFDKSACQPFWIIFMFIVIMQCSGTSIMFIWAIDMLEGSNISTASYIGNFTMGVTRFVVGILCSMLMYKIGRRQLALISSFGVGFICILLGAFIHYKIDPSLFPLIFYAFIVAFATLGYYTLPLLIMFEIYPLQVKGILGGFTISIMNLMIFGINKAFPYLKTMIGYANIIMIFGISSFLGFIFIYFYLPETRDLTLQEIEEYYNDRRATLVSQRRVFAAQLKQASNRNVLLDTSKTHFSKKKIQETDDAITSKND